MATFGGVVRFSFNGSLLVMRGHVTTYPSNMKAEPVVNQDSSISRTLTPMGFRAKCKFEDSLNGTPQPQAWDTILKGGPYTLSVIEDTTGVTHLWTGALLTGDISGDREKGEIDGIEWVAPTYQTLFQNAA